MNLPLLILLIYQIYHHLHHHVFFLRSTLGYHQREGNEGVVGYALVAVLCVKHMVVVEELQEQHGGNALVAIAEGMVLYYKVKQHGSLFLNRRIEVFASKSLVNLSDAALEGIILLVSKPLASVELFVISKL